MSRNSQLVEGSSAVVELELATVILPNPAYLVFSIVICQQFLPKAIDKELLTDVILAIRVLKGEIELVVLVQQLETFVGAGPRTSMRSTGSVDVNIYIFSKLSGIIQPPVPGTQSLFSYS